MSNVPVFIAIVNRLGLDVANPRFKIGPRAQRILREHQRRADRLRVDENMKFENIVERAMRDLAGRSSNDWDDPSRPVNFSR